MNHIAYRTLRKLFRQKNDYTIEYCDYIDQEANDYLLELIRSNDSSGLMISKFGTIELNATLCEIVNERGVTFSDLFRSIHGEYSVFRDEALEKLCNNAGFFPYEISLLSRYKNMVIEDANEIDVLGSYQKSEKYFPFNSNKCKRVNLDGYYAPFLWKKPWSSALEGKRVLVIHPFTESIKKQYYSNRKYLFQDQSVLPEFKELMLIKAVQTMANSDEQSLYCDWFSALERMKNEIDCIDFDIALIGCGAYGMHLAAHCKRKGKIAVHLAGWTQMLFGVYGNRWLEDQPEYSRYINEYWIRPNEMEKPKGADTVEKGAYW